MATPTKPPSGWWKVLPSTISCDGCAAILGAEIGVERGLPHGDEEDHVALLAGVLLGDLQFDGLAGVAEGGEERGDGLADLEVDGAVLDLDDDVGLELAVEVVEVVVAGAGAIGFEIVPVEVVVVDEAAVEDDAAVGLEGAGYDVGGLGWGAAVLRGAGAAFAVGLDDEAGEVGDRLVEVVDGRCHQAGRWGRGDRRSEGRRRPAGSRGRRRGRCARPRDERRRRCGRTRGSSRGEGAEVGVDVVDGDAVDADGGEEAGVLGDAGEVGADVAGVEEDGTAGVAALDGAVEVVPLVDPANGRGRRFRMGGVVFGDQSRRWKTP